MRLLSSKHSVVLGAALLLGAAAPPILMPGKESALSIEGLQITPAQASYGDPIQLTAILGNTSSRPVTVQLSHTFAPVRTYNDGEFWCGQPLGLPRGAAECAHQLEPACGGEITIPGRGSIEYSVTLDAGVLCLLPGVIPDPEIDQYIRLRISDVQKNGRIVDFASAQLPFTLLP